MNFIAIIIGGITKFVIQGLLGVFIVVLGFNLTTGVNIQSLSINAVSAFIAGAIMGRLEFKKFVLHGLGAWLVTILLGILFYLLLHYLAGNENEFDFKFLSRGIDLVFILAGIFLIKRKGIFISL